MAHPAREQKSQEIADAIEGLIAAYVARYIHMGTGDEPMQAARALLAKVLADGVR